MTSKAELIRRAQEIANATGKPRYVKYTSMGWRIECDPPAEPDDTLTVTVTPKSA